MIVKPVNQKIWSKELPEQEELKESLTVTVK